jgi:hypothetical protein
MLTATYYAQPQIVILAELLLLINSTRRPTPQFTFPQTVLVGSNLRSNLRSILPSYFLYHISQTIHTFTLEQKLKRMSGAIGGLIQPSIRRIEYSSIGIEREKQLPLRKFYLQNKQNSQFTLVRQYDLPSYRVVYIQNITRIGG